MRCGIKKSLTLTGNHLAQGLRRLLNIALPVNVNCDQGIVYRFLMFNVDPPIAYANTIRNTKKIIPSDKCGIGTIGKPWILHGDGADLCACAHRPTQTNTCD